MTEALPQTQDDVQPLVTADGLVRAEALCAWLRDLGAGDRIAETASNPTRRTEAVAFAEQWAKSDKWSLLLAGNVGAGKTTAAGRALRHAVDRVGFYDQSGKVVHSFQIGRARWVASQEIAELGYRDGWERRLSRLADIPWLVLDDLGREQASDLWQARLDDLVNRRWANRRRTIITANCSLATMRERYGHRIADRLRDGVIVELSGPSLRGGP